MSWQVKDQDLVLETFDTKRDAEDYIVDMDLWDNPWVTVTESSPHER